MILRDEVAMCSESAAYYISIVIVRIKSMREERWMAREGERELN